jgi:hypothetical protein
VEQRERWIEKDGSPSTELSSSPTARKGAGRRARRTHPRGAPFCCIQRSARERHEPSPVWLTRIYRQSPLNSIWEASGNVVCLDILRAIQRDPRSAMELVAELEKSYGANKLLDRAIDDVKTYLAGPPDEATARRLAETMALALQDATLVRNTQASSPTHFVQPGSVTIQVFPAGH